MRVRGYVLFLALALFCFPVSVRIARADNVYGKIRGTVTDPSGAVVPHAKVIAINTATGISKETTSEADGSYEFPQLDAPAVYSVSVEADGFKKAQVTDIHLSLNQIFVEDIHLQLGAATELVTVTEQSTTQVETTNMELGVDVDSNTIVNMPLNGRFWSDLMQLQPGVVAASDARGGNGEGNYATNGSESDQNSYLINGTDNNDLPLNEVQINPSPDAIAEFKMVTSTINPEYGRNSGAILNAIIKSGTNQFHGDGFDFYRDTSLNARNYFQPAPAVFHRNQFGATIGGPIRKDHTFFFFSYQGSRSRRLENSGDCGCASPGTVHVFTAAQRAGSFPDIPLSANVSPFPLVGEGGTTYPAGTPYSTIFPSGQIPQADINPISSKLLSFVPPPTVGSTFQFNPVYASLDDQYLGRVDHTFNSSDSIWGYFLWERLPFTTDLPFLGATLPGFASTNAEHWQQYTLAWNHIFNSTTLNEVRIGYTRLNYLDVVPVKPTAPSSAGFTGVTPQFASGEGLPVVNVSGLFELGFSLDGPQPRKDQTYQFTDNFTKIVGAHSLKFGFEMRRFEVYNPFLHVNDGDFTFAGAGTFSTGDAGADFLLGIPDNYTQGSGDILNERAQEYYSYAQDQWKIRPNLTLTIGAGWSIDTPMADIQHDNHAGIAFRPGQQSTIFPTAPAGYVFQGDPGVHAFGTTKYAHWGPRVGFAYSPDWGRLTGGPGKTSIRGGYGIYYNRFNGETALQVQGSPPFSQTSFGIGDVGGSPSFANPFSGYELSGGVVTPVSIPNKFPYTPSATPNFSALEPLSVAVYDPRITIPNSQNYNLTIQRQFGASTVISLGYVGAEGRHLPLAVELNPGLNPAGCAANPTCVADRATQPTAFPGNFKYPGNIFASIGDITTEGSSNYNAFQTTVNKSFSHGLQFLASYTWSHALDIASGFENSGFNGSGSGGFGELRSTNPFNQHLDYGDSNYDARHRLVISYIYQFPSIHSSQWIVSRLVDGWQISGITTFQRGFPLDVVDSSCPSLTANDLLFFNTPGLTCGWDVPNVVGPIQYTNPRTAPNNQWVSPSAFAHPAFGTQGDAGRDIVKGPGLNNFDFAVMKDIRVTESTKAELRFEFFNVFNHTQFDPNGITTDINSPAFGTETGAHDPRIIQLAGKFYF